MRAGLCFASAELGTDFQQFFEGGDARVVRVAEQFHGSMSKIDEETRKAMVRRPALARGCARAHAGG